MTAERNNNITDTIKAYGKRLFGFIRKRVNSNEDAEDILQEVFYQFAGNTTPIEQVSSWLFTVARNKVTDSYRKQKLPLADDVVAASNDDDSFDWREFLIADDNSPETAYIRNLFWEELQQALDELPVEQKNVFIQNELEDIPFKIISEQTGVSVATLISRKRYAVLHLRERLANLRNELLNY
ncbi:RNA polymerase sigma factor [Ferruginibacter albus]|uniref:RNA polymerase sigma factor n=1 Tax=Ferruginibacter albus TaxID=2875540 RepID=UPI001CC7EDDB|nr:sigma-70 family RNA polymerase sigma factor [Ferruginibacter albus]